MADLGPAVGGILQLVGPLLGPLLKRAVGAFVGTTAGMVALGVVALAASWAIAGADVWWHGAIAGAVSLALFAVLGVILAGKRAVGAALTHALREANLGGKVVRVLFGRILGVDESGALGERGGALAREVERIPLAQAEQQLAEAVRRLTKATEDGRGLRAWLRRSIESALLERVAALTLSRFREADTREGGVDLVIIRDQLGGQVDGLIVDQVQGTLGRLTVLLVGGAALGSVLVALLIRQYL